MQSAIYIKTNRPAKKVNNFVIEKANLQGITMNKEQIICNSCYLTIGKNKPSDDSNEPFGSQNINLDQEYSTASSSSSDKEYSTASSSLNEEQFINLDISSFNDTLKSIDSSPLVHKKMRSENYKQQKFKEVTTKISEEIFRLPCSSEHAATDISGDSIEIIQQLREKYYISTTTNEKYMILTSVPKSWSVRKIQDEFGVSYYMANRAKQIQKEKGIMSTPNIKLGSTILNQETALLAQKFYEDDDISRVCAGKRDFKTISSDGVIETKQRRLVLCNLKEVYQIFKKTYPNTKIGFSSFAALRPGHCVLANSSGTHSICVCIYHQNIKLMFNKIKSINLLSHEEGSYQDLISQIICANPSTSCYLNECTTCPGTDNFREELSAEFLENNIDEITFKQWQKVDRCTMETITVSSLAFTDKLGEQLHDIVPHSFIAKQQADYLKYRKSNAATDECLVICDFSENYSFVVQDAVQGFHWSNAQCTIHPFAVYYKNGESSHTMKNDSSLEFTSLIALSESTKHNHVAVRLFITGLVNFIKEKLRHIKKICFFSDGSGAQYKNKMNFYNLCNFKEDFDMEAEWHFFATCHGKGPCDALGGVLKRNAARASLQRPFEKQITTPRELYSWAEEKESRVNYVFFTTTNYNKMEKQLKNRYSSVKQIAGTHKYHSFCPINKTSLDIRKFSFCTRQKLFDIE